MKQARRRNTLHGSSTCCGGPCGACCGAAAGGAGLGANTEVLQVGQLCCRSNHDLHNHAAAFQDCLATVCSAHMCLIFSVHESGKPLPAVVLCAVVQAHEHCRQITLLDPCLKLLQSHVAAVHVAPRECKPFDCGAHMC